MTTVEPLRIPLTVIGGFLGAGKTTYLNRLISQGLPPDSLIIVNDFGNINIDAALINYRDDSIMQLSNGCICCTLGGTLAEQLAAALRIRATPGSILIEASGVADPARIADIARISKRLYLAGVICLIDGSAAQLQAQDPLLGDAWRAQLKAADCLQINRLDESQRAEFEDWLRPFNPSARYSYDESAEWAGVEQSAAPTTRLAAAPQLRAGLMPTSHGQCRSFSLRSHQAVDKVQLTQLLEEHLDVLIRAKGFVLTQTEQALELLQLSARRLAWQRTLRRSSETQLVFIGIAGARFNALEAAIKRLFN